MLQKEGEGGDAGCGKEVLVYLWLGGERVGKGYGEDSRMICGGWWREGCRLVTRCSVRFADAGTSQPRET